MKSETEQYEILRSQKQWSKRSYKQSGEEQIPEELRELVSILREQKEKRTEQKVEKLIRNIEHLDFFQKMKTKTGINGDQSLLYSCAKCLGFEQYNKGEIVCMKGEVSDRFFVVLEGAVNIYIQKEEQQLEDEKKQRRVYIRKEIMQVRMSQVAQIYGKQGIVVYYLMKDTLRKGAIFGELGLIRNKPRAATVICLQDTYFASLTRVEDTKMNQKIEFFMQNLFKECSRDKIAKICYDFERENYNYKQIIYKENDESRYIYIIKKGQVKLTKQYVYMETKKSLETKREIISFMRSTETEKTLTVQIGDLIPGQSFGEDDVLYNRNRTVNTISMSHQTKLYKIEKNKFLKIIADLQIYNMFQQRALVKDSWRNQQLLTHKKQLKTTNASTFNNIFENIQSPKAQEIIQNSTKIKFSIKELRLKASNLQMIQQTGIQQQQQQQVQNGEKSSGVNNKFQSIQNIIKYNEYILKKLNSNNKNEYVQGEGVHQQKQIRSSASGSLLVSDVVMTQKKTHILERNFKTPQTISQPFYKSNKSKSLFDCFIDKFQPNTDKFPDNYIQLTPQSKSNYNNHHIGFSQFILVEPRLKAQDEITTDKIFIPRVLPLESFRVKKMKTHIQEKKKLKDILITENQLKI